MRRSILTILILFSFSILLSYSITACRKNDNPNNLQLLSQTIPEGFGQPLYSFNDNPLSEEGVELGRKLFYDGRLSIDGIHPCASCHQQIAGFGTFEHDRSHGVFSSHTLRNAPVLFNLAWQPYLHWDGEFKTLFEEAAQPINGHTEMGESFGGVIDRLQKDAEYRKAFKEVFHSEFISPENMLKALAQFTGTLISANSRYDRYKKNELTFTATEQHGYEIFQLHCNSCHKEPMFTDYSFRNTGLPVDDQLNDYGRMRITKEPGDSLKFKVPTLRNLSISSNYMHDGRFASITQCLNHYRTGVQNGPTTDSLVSGGILLTDQEATDLGVFLRTLTDSAFLTNPKYSKP